MLVYGRDTVLQVVHNHGHGFQKDLPCRGAQQHTHDQPRKNQIKTQQGFHDKAITGFRNISGGHPLEYTRNETGRLRDGLKVVGTAVNDWEPESVAGLVDTAELCHDPKQYSVLLAQS